MGCQKKEEAKASTMRDWSEGAPGWKVEMRKLEKALTTELKANENDEPSTDVEDWKKIAGDFYGKIFHVDDDEFSEFHDHLNSFMEEAKNDAWNEKFNTDELDDAIISFLAKKAMGRDTKPAYFLKTSGGGENKTVVGLFQH